MPDKRIHRGPNPRDAKLFAAGVISELRAATADFSLLLTKGYAEKSALKLVGDRFSLTERQRAAVKRNACSELQLACRKKTEVKIAEIAGQRVVIDGYNVLITIEAAMAGAVIFKSRDGCFKDLASVHGTYRRVTETIPALQLIGRFLKENGAAHALWLLDSPVSNSGRLKILIGKLAEQTSWDWNVELVANPDAELIKTDFIVATSDGAVLDKCKRWVNLAAAIIKQKLRSAKVIDLSIPR